MRKVVNKFRVMINALIATALSALGVTSCTQFIKPAYGVAYPDDYCNIEIDGAVTDEQGEPLQAVQVVVKTAKAGYIAGAFTNQAGEFHCNGGGIPDRGTDTLQVLCTDTSNVYVSNSVKVAFTDMEVERESEWERDYFVDIKVQLKKK